MMSVEFSFTLVGVGELVATLNRLRKNMPRAMASAIYTEAQIEMTESKQRCPVDTGVLRASGTVHDPVIGADNTVRVDMTYGGAASAYAIAVHEHLSKWSPPSWVKAELFGDGVHWSEVGTGPKFLESVLNESRPYMAARLARHLGLDGILAGNY